MSISALNWALNIHVESSSQKLVLLLLANFADEQGRSWPSQKVIADKACLSVRSVVTALAELEKSGRIRREARWRPGGSRGTDIIHLVMAAGNVQDLHSSSIGEEIAPMAKSAKSVGQTCKKRPTKPANPSPLTTFEPPLEPSLTHSEANASGGAAAGNRLSVKDRCWMEGKANLQACGMTPKQAGDFIGNCLKRGYPHAAILSASYATADSATDDPIRYMGGVLRKADEDGQTGRPRASPNRKSANPYLDMAFGDLGGSDEFSSGAQHPALRITSGSRH